MTLALPPEDMASASYSQSTNLYTVTDSSGQRFEMTEESFDEFISSMETTLGYLGDFRAQLLNGSTVSVRPYIEEYPQAGSYVAEVDTLNLKLGGFDDAIELQEAYRTVFYPSRAEQLDRVYHGLDTGRVISQDIKTSYLENDGDISADVVNVQNEFNSRGGDISASDIDDVRTENERVTEQPPAGTEPSADEQPRQL
jgi:hypothetical protein